MPRPIKYPFGALQVGDSVTVGDVPSRQSVYTAMARFRDECLRLGWPADALPLFAMDWSSPGSVRITRLEDGRPGRWALPAPLSQASEVQAVERAQAAWIAANVAHLKAGEDRQSCPPDLMDAALACDIRHGTTLARTLAEIDLRPAAELLAHPHPRRRATDTPHELQSCAEPRDVGLCARLTAACKSSQVR